MDSEPALGHERQTAIGGFGDIENDHRGDVVTIPVNGVPIGGYVTVTLGSKNAGYVSNVTVRDENRDGSVSLRWNSYLADQNQELGEDSPWSAVGGDTVLSQNVYSTIADGPSHIITAGTYTLEAREGRITDGAAERAPSALSTVTLSSRSSERVRTWTAPERLSGELTSVSDLEATAGDTLTRTGTLAKGDLLVTSIRASGLEGVLRAQDGDTTTTKFYDAVAEDIITLNHTHLQAGATNRESDTITVNYRETSGDVTVIADYQNDAYYVVQQTSSEDRFRTRRSFSTQFTVESLAEGQSNYGLVTPTSNGEFEDELLTSSFDVTPGRISIATTPDGQVEVRAQANQAISGTSTYAPGTTFRVRAQSKTGSTSQFIIGPREVTVQPDGSWSMAADFSSYAVGSTFSVVVSDGDGNQVIRDGEIRGKPEVRALSFADQESAGEVVAVSEVEFNAGGFVALHKNSASGPIVGQSSYIEKNELTRNLLVVLDEPLESSTTLVAVPHTDANNNQEFDPGIDTPYTVGGSPVTDAASIALEGARPDFQVSALEPGDVTVASEESLTVSATVTNAGDATGTQTVAWRVDSQAVVSRELTLSPGESQTVEFPNVNADVGETGSYEHGVFTDDDSETATLTIADERASRDVSLSVDPGNVTVDSGEEVGVSATIRNTGETRVSTSVDLLIDGSILDRTSVTVTPGETATVEFDEIQTGGLTADEYTYTVTTGTVSRTNVLTVTTATSGSVESLTFGDRAPGTDEATLESVELSDGGFIAIHEGSASGPVVGVSDYIDGGQRHQNVTISYSDSVADGSSVVAVAHYDTNDNRAFDYSASDTSTDEPYATNAAMVAQQEVSNDGSGDENSGSGIPSSGGFVETVGVVPLLGAGILGLGIVGYGLRRFRSDDDGPVSPTDTDHSQQTSAERANTPTNSAQTDSDGQTHSGQPNSGQTHSGQPNSGQTAAETPPADAQEGQTQQEPPTESASGTAPTERPASTASDRPGTDTAEGTDSPAPSVSPPALEQEVPALSDVVLRTSGTALGTYGATLATRDGDVSVEVVSVAPDIEVDETLRNRFEQATGQWYNASTHPNVRTIHDRGTDPRPWIALEDLSNVDSLATRRSELSLEQTVDVMGDVVEAVRNVGLYNGTHHNLTPDCIRVVADADGYTAIVDDWGVERTVHEHVDGDYVTPYTAPEQLGDGTTTDRTDVYGLGAVAYYALTGEPPVSADPAAIRAGDITHANDAVQMPAELDIAVMTALSTDPTDRHRSVYDFGQSLSSSLR